MKRDASGLLQACKDCPEFEIVEGDYLVLRGVTPTNPIRPGDIVVSDDETGSAGSLHRFDATEKGRMLIGVVSAVLRVQRSSDGKA